MRRERRKRANDIVGSTHNRRQIVKRPSLLRAGLDLDLSQAAREAVVYLSRVPRYRMRTVALTLAMWRIVAARTTSRCYFWRRDPMRVGWDLTIT